MKIAPLVRELGKHSGVEFILVHTGQHYDDVMSKLFFEDLGLPEPDTWLGVGSGSHAQQTARIMAGFEEVVAKEKPDLVIVVGDVNSTIACALVAVKLGVKVAHVEAGLRSFDRSMPEEVNRVLTDQISDLLFVTEQSGIDNLRKEGIPDSRIHFVGNLMVDTLVSRRDKAEQSNILAELGVEGGKYALLTLHRPSNVDDKHSLESIISVLEKIQEDIKVVFPIHPRTKKMMSQHGLTERLESLDGIIMSEPLGYLDFLKLMAHAKFVLTDSGGIQEETTVLGVPCLTLRENTERPVTVEEGTNVVVGSDRTKILQAVDGILAGHGKKGRIPKLWDGRAAERIVKLLLEYF
jgi:UDP-N-acetylglucosamine 2-epimerase (non-hydrolysing)